MSAQLVRNKWRGVYREFLGGSHQIADCLPTPGSGTPTC